MSEILLICFCIYLWLVGGIFLAIAAADADFKDVPRHRIWLLVLGWPVITFFSAVFVSMDVVEERVKTWRAR